MPAATETSQTTTVEERPLTPEAGFAQVARQALRADERIGLVGLELESHLVDLREPGRRPDWDTAVAAAADIAPLPAGSLVTLEPGGQLELSAPPVAGVDAAVAGLRADLAAARQRLRDRGLGLATLGADPARPLRRLHPGERYAAMESHFKGVGTGGAGLAMMCSTASLQVNLDAGPEAGWSERVSLAHALGPVFIALSACSPLLAGRETGWRSSRQRIWDELDRARCGPLLGGDDPAAEWAAYALVAPVMLVHSPTSAVTQRVPFGAWAAGDVTLGGRRPTAADLDYHLTTLFPPVRLRGFLEIRYLDAAPDAWWPTLATALVALMDNPRVSDHAREAVAPVTHAWTDAARLGVTDPALQRAALRCLELAGGVGDGEARAGLERLHELVARGRCPGDATLEVARRDGALAALTAGAQ